MKVRGFFDSLRRSLHFYD